MKRFITVLVLTLLFANCSKNDDQIITPVIGKWQLIKVEANNRTSTTTITDYTSQNIIYEFTTNSNLNVNSDHSIFKAGNYNYEFKSDYLSGFPSAGETKTLVVIIDNQKWTYQLVNKQMILGTSYFDGPDLYLEKI